MEEDPVTHQANNQLLDLQCERKIEKEDMKQELGLENTQDNYIKALILYRMCYSHKCCKTATEVTMRLKSLTYNNDRFVMMKGDIQIYIYFFEWEEFKTQW